MGRCCYVHLRRRHDVSIRRRGDVPLRSLNDVPPRRRWVFHLRHTCDVAGTFRERRRYDVATTSCCRVGPLFIMDLPPVVWCSKLLKVDKGFGKQEIPQDVGQTSELKELDLCVLSFYSKPWFHDYWHFKTCFIDTLDDVNNIHQNLEALGTISQCLRRYLKR